MTHFTLVVPTRERADTLLWTLKTCVAQDYDNLTILVSDNCSQDNTEEVVKSFNDSRIRYIKTPERISMPANWDFALEHVENGYVCFIGDDDGLIPNALKNVDAILHAEPVDAITSKDMAIYYWPNHINKDFSGNFAISLRPTYEVLNTKKFFRKSYESVASIHLPQLYHGFVKADIIHNLSKKHGNFFKSTCPDLYAAVILGHTLTRHIFSSYPLTIHGLSQHSIGSSSTSKKGNENVVNQYWSEKPPPFHEKLEVCASSCIVQADSFMIASKYFPEIPELEIKKVIAAVYSEISGYKYSDTKTAIIEALRVMGDKNNLRNYVESILRQGVETVRSTNKLNYGLNPVNEMVILKTSELGLKNVYDVSLLAKNLLHHKVYSKYDRPLNEGVLDYFFRGFQGMKKKFIK